MKGEHLWKWPIAAYLFLGGLGGGMVVVSAVMDLFLSQGSIFVFGNFAAAAFIALGTGFLVLDLGKPLRFYRVLSTQRAIITIGAWLLTLFMLTSIVYGSFWISFLSWSDLKGLRKIFAWSNLLLGLSVVTYTGILLGSMKARPFWNSPILTVLFLISGISTGIAAQTLLIPLTYGNINHAGLANIIQTLHIADEVLLTFELFVLFVYVFMMRTSAGETASRSAATWLVGGKKWSFWGGLVLIGLLFPLIIYFLGYQSVLFLSPCCVLAGGLILRLLVVYTDDRKLVPGEIFSCI